MAITASCVPKKATEGMDCSCLTLDFNVAYSDARSHKQKKCITPTFNILKASSALPLEG
ncbi:Hypothetical predicted protein [Podarcis lilfordi]|uniref:Uncharacterized protein n=1 Tax=Podarcis lilfordi TaxID=74358 RepID=A0AA35LF29_9SAUR|nr:Hypothetical predicted protein [Podarcis lilfordi]